MSKQTEIFAGPRGRVMAMNSAYDVLPQNRARDVVVNASYVGVLPARYIGSVLPRGSISIDCAAGPQGAAIAGLWYLEALNVPAAAADVAGVILGDGMHLHDNGVISYLNRPAADCGVRPRCPITGMPASTRRSTTRTTGRPPSILTAAAPPSFSKRPALRTASSALT